MQEILSRIPEGMSKIYPSKKRGRNYWRNFRNISLSNLWNNLEKKSFWISWRISESITKDLWKHLGGIAERLPGKNVWRNSKTISGGIRKWISREISEKCPERILKGILQLISGRTFEVMLKRVLEEILKGIPIPDGISGIIREKYRMKFREKPIKESREEFQDKVSQYPHGKSLT